MEGGEEGRIHQAMKENTVSNMGGDGRGRGSYFDRRIRERFLAVTVKERLE